MNPPGECLNPAELQNHHLDHWHLPSEATLCKVIRGTVDEQPGEFDIM